MVKIDEIKLADTNINDGDYKVLCDALKKTYDNFDTGKFVRVLKVKTRTVVYWSDIDGDSGITDTRGGWCHTSWREGDDDEERSSHLNKVEMRASIEETFYTLKIIEDPDGPRDFTPSYDWENNTIKVREYDRLKNQGPTKQDSGTSIIVFINDV